VNNDADRTLSHSILVLCIEQGFANEQQNR